MGSSTMGHGLFVSQFFLRFIVADVDPAKALTTFTGLLALPFIIETQYFSRKHNPQARRVY